MLPEVSDAGPQGADESRPLRVEGGRSSPERPNGDVVSDTMSAWSRVSSSRAARLVLLLC